MLLMMRAKFPSKSSDHWFRLHVETVASAILSRRRRLQGLCGQVLQAGGAVHTLASLPHRIFFSTIISRFFTVYGSSKLSRNGVLVAWRKSQQGCIDQSEVPRISCLSRPTSNPSTLCRSAFYPASLRHVQCRGSDHVKQDVQAVGLAAR